MCGIVSIVGKSQVNQAIYDALIVLQHRGQDAAGIATDDSGRLRIYKNVGLVADVFTQSNMDYLHGNMGIGHVRYPTAGSIIAAEAQPFYVNSPYGITLAHNGNLINAKPLSEEIYQQDRRHVNTGSDSEVLLNVFAHELASCNSLKPTSNDIFTAVRKTHKRIKGAYAVVAMISSVGVVGFRDPFAIRPMVIGYRDETNGREYMIASESVALDTLGFTLMRDIKPGEAVFITHDGQIYSQQCHDSPQYSPCIFEYIYLARPDSVIDGISVYKSRLRMGEMLAEKIMRMMPEHDIDVVIPIPDTSRAAALQLAHKLGIRFREGFIKNRYIGRTFIMPNQQLRKKSVRQKLNAIDLEFKGKNVLLVDDSIVRGTTCQQIVQMARNAGAKKVYFASAAPAVKFPNVYGINMPTKLELIAYDKTDEEVGTLIGVDKLFYQDLEALIEAVDFKGRVGSFDTSVFDGKYVAGKVDEEYFGALEESCIFGATRDNLAHVICDA